MSHMLYVVAEIQKMGIASYHTMSMILVYQMRMKFACEERNIEKISDVYLAPWDASDWFYGRVNINLYHLLMTLDRLLRIKPIFLR